MKLEPISIDWAVEAGCVLERLRNTKPLIYTITNFVTVNDVANAITAIGASPIMSASADEAAELVGYAGSILINLGTINKPQIDLAFTVCNIAAEKGVPVTLDPVGAGASHIRTNTNLQLLEQSAVVLVRGNLAEITSLADVTSTVKTKGVDSVGDETTHADEAILALHAKLGRGAVCATGKIDSATDGQHLVYITNGHSLMPAISGTGCQLGGICGAFLAVTDPLTATVSALLSFAIAAEIAAERSNGPGSLKVGIFDALYNLTPEDFIRRAQVESFRVS
ncbi:hydroxyethylthiazole kinase [Scytonema sp. UIC 10036]|uniref:hydroxyethylthiazole kinase n=1 Tax=Scytonema sp. UIC 10036 TaxID=2304196 RepID=UPI0012DAEEFA|nr:hydroxyethylthiazole kinase [Scytonema sp. UIC 10036]MUG99110.1 hydroxyethylthiazole kinase [Scytonema sp. UIC 10036]